MDLKQEIVVGDSEKILVYTTNFFNIGIIIINETTRHDNTKTIKL